MTNWEKYKEYIKSTDGGICYVCKLRTGKTCADTKCNIKKDIEFLFEKYKEPIVLTKVEREVLLSLRNVYSNIRVSYDTGYVILHRGENTDHLYLKHMFRGIESNKTYDIEELLANCEIIER